MSSHPNPFAISTRIEFTAAAGSDVELEVFDVRGRRVAALRTTAGGEGNSSLQWDGRDGSGRDLPSGVYLARLRTESDSATHRLMLLR